MEFKKSMKYTNKKRTICEVIREINDVCTDQVIIGMLKEIHDMAKRMTKKLYEYNKEWDAEFWQNNHDYEQDLLRRLK